MDNKGFAISGILYTVFIIFMVSITMMLFNLQNRKTILDELKADAVDAVESDNNYEYLLNEINTLKSDSQPIDITSLVTFYDLTDFNLKDDQSSIIKVGNVIYINLTYTLNTNGAVDINKVVFASIPEEYRPTQITALTASFLSYDISNNSVIDMTIRTSGEIRTASWSSRTINVSTTTLSSQYLYIYGSYVINS